MTTQDSRQGADSPSAAFAAAQEALVRQSQAHLRSYADILDLYGTMAKSWLERRRAAIQSALAAAEKIAHASSNEEAVRAYNDWMLEAVRQFGDDLTQFGEHIATIPQRTLANLQDLAPGAIGAAPTGPAAASEPPVPPDAAAPESRT